MAINIFWENHTNIETTTAFERETVEPTDKSNPSTESEIVIPIAIMVTMEIDLKILTMFDPWIKLGFAIAKIAIKTKIVIIVPYLYKNSNSSNPFFAGLVFGTGFAHRML